MPTVYTPAAEARCVPRQMAAVQRAREAWPIGAWPPWRGSCVRTTETSPPWRGQGSTRLAAPDALLWAERRTVLRVVGAEAPRHAQGPRPGESPLAVVVVSGRVAGTPRAGAGTARAWRRSAPLQVAEPAGAMCPPRGTPDLQDAADRVGHAVGTSVRRGNPLSSCERKGPLRMARCTHGDTPWPNQRVVHERRRTRPGSTMANCPGHCVSYGHPELGRSEGTVAGSDRGQWERRGAVAGEDPWRCGAPPPVRRSSHEPIRSGCPLCG